MYYPLLAILLAAAAHAQQEEDVTPPAPSVWIDAPPKYQCPSRSVYPCNCTRGSDEGIYLECSNTNLASLAVGLTQVRTLVHTLTIDGCNFEKLYGDVFKGLTVKKMIVRDTPIKDISDNTLNDLADTMKELYIENSWLTRVPPSVKNLTGLKYLSFQAITENDQFNQPFTF